MAKKASSKGGKRKGAGRKPAPSGTQRIMLSIKLDPIVMEYLSTRQSKTGTIEGLIKTSEDFRAWLQSRQS